MFSLVEIKKALDGTKKNVCVIRECALSVFVLTGFDCSMLQSFVGPLSG